MRKIAKIFGFNSSQHSLRTEVFAGISTFIVMAYILALAPKAFEGVGGTADPFPTAALFTATALVSAVSTFLMAVYAKRPLAVAPGVGLLFFISGTVCMQMGYSWHFALTAILLEGVLFTVLAFSRLRYLIMESIPLSLRSATAVGVGLFLASLGLKSAGMTDSGAAIVSLASIVTEPEKQLFAICVMLSGVLIVYRVKGAIFLSIIASTILGIPLGLTRFDAVMTIPESPAPLFMQMEWSEDIFSIDMFVCVVSIFFLDVFDTIGTVSGVLSTTNLSRSNGRISRMSHIFQVDAISSMLSGLMGTTTCTSYLESAAGVAEGGRTGVTSLVTVICFLFALFFSPIFLAIPPVVTGAILLVVSFQMFAAIKHINFTNPVEAIPSVLVILVMAIIGSISDGIVVGVITYAVLNFTAEMKQERERRKRGHFFTINKDE
ncbi:MAG: NCS2 family permease [Prevotella sp.]|nr:NCS2 family permease [Prevotella sp.]